MDWTPQRETQSPKNELFTIIITDRMNGVTSNNTPNSLFSYTLVETPDFM